MLKCGLNVKGIEDESGGGIDLTLTYVLLSGGVFFGACCADLGDMVQVR